MNDPADRRSQILKPFPLGGGTEVRMIDWDIVAELMAAVGPAEMAEVVTLFLDDTDAAVRALAPDRDLEAQLHYLKGSATTMGFRDFLDLCNTAEIAASHGRVVDIDALRACYARSRAAFVEGLPARLPDLPAAAVR